MKRFCLSLLTILLFTSTVLTGCGSDSRTEGAFLVYFKHVTKRELYPVEAEIEENMPIDTRIASVWKHLKSGGSDRSSYVSSVPSTISLKNYVLNGSNLIFNFDQPYTQLPQASEVLFRASLVKTFTQFPEVAMVEIQVDGQPLQLSDGSIPGPMKASDFIDVFGSGLNAYTETMLSLYFANENADGLVKEDVKIMYNNTIPLEQAVVRRLILGPESEELYPTIPAETRLISVSIKNGICYLNFNEAFLYNTQVTRPEITIYSIVNSLTEINGINAVSIAVSGSSSISYMDQFDLSAPLYRNMNFLSSPEPETEEAP